MAWRALARCGSTSAAERPKFRACSCSSSGTAFAVGGDGAFGSGGGEREAARLKVPLLGQIPIEMAVREGGDIGRPVVSAEPDGAVSQEFGRIAVQLRESIEA